jgi:hypothetical protein
MGPWRKHTVTPKRSCRWAWASRAGRVGPSDVSRRKKKLLLRKAWEAVPGGGACIVYDSIIDGDRRSNVFGLLMRLNMLIETPGGFDYRGADCMGWMREVGFSSAFVEHLAGPDSMVVGIKEAVVPRGGWADGVDGQKERGHPELARVHGRWVGDRRLSRLPERGTPGDDGGQNAR